MNLLQGCLIVIWTASLALPALAGPHPAMKPVDVENTIPTFGDNHKVGQVVFSFGLQKAPAGASVPNTFFNGLTMTAGNPPNALWARAFHTATLKETVDKIKKGKTVEGIKGAWLVFVDNDQVLHTKSAITDSQMGPTWNTSAVDILESAGDVLAELKPGQHTITVWRQVEYKEWLLHEKGYHEWFDKYIALAKGQLKITVTP